MMNNKIYFPGFNTIRFFAAAAVIVSHIEQFKQIAGLPNIWAGWVAGLASSGVSLFFALSGFLITYLLLAEQQKHNSISVRSFYWRRVLRIWPLYYLIVIVAFFVLPHLIDFAGSNELLRQNFGAKLGLFALILPNVALAFYAPVLGASQAWSIGVEEQFYLMWPVLMRAFKGRALSLFIFVVAFKLVTLRAAYWFLAHGTTGGWSQSKIDGFNGAIRVWQTFQIETLAMGAIGAYLIFQHRETLGKRVGVLLHPAAQLVYLAAALLFIAKSGWFFHSVIEAVLFAALVTNVAYNKRLFVLPETGVLNHFGAISYGIYMIHPTVISLVLVGLSRFPALHSHMGGFNLVLYGVTVAVTLGLATLSYRFYETPFLTLKKRFVRVPSGFASMGENPPAESPVVSAQTR